MDFIEFSKNKGFFYQASNEEGLKKLLAEKSIIFYIGFDCTATSLHVGSLFQIMNVRNLQKFGHKPVILMGSGTSRIGDPSFRVEVRPVLSDEQIQKNKEGIKKSLEKFIKFGQGETDAVMVDNYDWLSKINYLDFLRDFGSLVSINKMLTYDIIKTKLDNQQNLSFLEFNYMLLQGYDFLHLNQEYNCRLQLGGADQWVNIINGVELGRRKSREELFGLTSPLLTTSSGQKMGKTAQGAVWLNEDLLPAYEYYQYWRNTEDKDVIRFLHIFTDLSDEEINELSNLSGKEINQAKKILAYEATKLCHGEEKALNSQKTAENVFEKGEIQGEIARQKVSRSNVEMGKVTAADLVFLTNLVKSKSEARRMISAGAVKFNEQRQSDEFYVVKLADFVNDELNVNLGKKNFVILTLADEE